MTRLMRGIAMHGLGFVLALAAGAEAGAQTSAMVYRAELAPLNAGETKSRASGEAIFSISGDQMTIRVQVSGASPNMMHLQHFHGFATKAETARCPTSSADRNGDGVVDLIETEPLAGTTLVPFNNDPVGMTIATDTYPAADANGFYVYEKTVPFKALQEAFGRKFPGHALDLDRRVVFIHGVPASTSLPKSVASLGDIPAQVTIPIACGEIRKAAP